MDLAAPVAPFRFRSAVRGAGQSLGITVAGCSDSGLDAVGHDEFVFADGVARLSGLAGAMAGEHSDQPCGVDQPLAWSSIAHGIPPALDGGSAGAGPAAVVASMHTSTALVGAVLGVLGGVDPQPWPTGRWRCECSAIPPLLVVGSPSGTRRLDQQQRRSPWLPCGQASRGSAWPSPTRLGVVAGSCCDGHASLLAVLRSNAGGGTAGTDAVGDGAKAGELWTLVDVAGATW